MMIARVRKHLSGILHVPLIRKVILLINFYVWNYKEHYFREKVEEMKIVQKLRERPTGINVVGLALGENVASDIIMVRYLDDD